MRSPLKIRGLEILYNLLILAIDIEIEVGVNIKGGGVATKEVRS